MASAFAAPIMIDSDLRDGSLRDAALDEGIPILLYEAGEALRLDEVAVRAGVSGVIGVMREIGMLPKSRRRRPFKPLVSRESRWLRAPGSGVVRLHRGLGDMIEAGETIGEVSHPIGTDALPIVSEHSGMIIGLSRLPLVHEGEALVHVASLAESEEEAEGVIDAFEEAHDPEENTAGGERPLAG